ncbi:MAG: FG-GAP repeat protein, partial [Candidatus Delongbacteria bacterium]|nr:FG-GAP repeat protein [Candidatus Delongbacteria bacterium]
FGKASGYTASLDLSDLDGSNGFIINGIDAFDRSGYSVSSAGDVNGDGLADIIIGARFADPNGNDLAGESYVVFGKASGLTSSLDLSDLDGYNGFIINGIDQDDRSGYSVSSAGDVNGDGYSDIIIGARFADPNGNDLAGESYVIFGFSNPTSENNSFTLYEDTQYSFTNAEGSEDFPFDDVDGDQLVSVEITTLPSLGTIYLDGNNNNEIDNDEVLDALDEVEVANIAKLKYKPVVNNNGTPYTTFTFKVSDGKNYCEDSYTMTINVNPVNDAPENTTVSTITPVGTIRIGGTIGATVGVWNDNDDNNQNEVKRK